MKRAVLILALLLTGCGDAVFDPDFFELTPGSHQCRRALSGILRPGDSELRDRRVQAEILDKCLPKGGAGGGTERPNIDDEE